MGRTSRTLSDRARVRHSPGKQRSMSSLGHYLTEAATLENTLLAFRPIVVMAARRTAMISARKIPRAPLDAEGFQVLARDAFASLAGLDEPVRSSPAVQGD